MFKSFTDSVTAFMGGKKPEDAETSVNADGSSDEPSPSTTGGLEEVQEEKDKVSANGDGGKPPLERADSKAKVPPPRPAAPPLSAASSVSKPDTPPSTPVKSVEKDPETENSTEAGEDTEEAKKDKIDEKLEEVTEKARQWGSYLFSMTKSAGASMSAKASELKKAVKENTIVGDFLKEQDKFMNEKKEKARAQEAAVPPWVGYNEEAQMKEQMLTLSNDQRNFVRSPPSGIQFHFDYDTCYPVAMATLAEDPNLEKMRFELVPKKVTEHDFWRNYFYRVSLIKQSTQLTSLAKQSSSSNITQGETTPKDEAVVKQADSLTTTEVAESNSKVLRGDVAADGAAASDAADLTEDVDATTAPEEFVSDAYNLEISDEDLIKEMEALRSSPGGNEGDWEFEVVGGDGTGTDLDIDEAALEREIMAEMDKSGDDLK